MKLFIGMLVAAAVVVCGYARSVAPVAVANSVSVDAAKAAADGAGKDPITQITREHSPSQPDKGPWPYFIVRLRADGTAFYKGGRGMPLEGLHNGHVDQADYESLSQALRNMHYEDLDGDSMVDTDMAYESLTVVHGGKIKELWHSHASGFVPGRADDEVVETLSKFEAQVDAVVKHIHWTKAKPLAKK